MGCCNEKMSSSEQKMIETTVSRYFIEKTGLAFIDSLLFDRLLYRYSVRHIILEKKFKAFCHASGLNSEEFLLLCNNFKTDKFDNDYDCKKIDCLGVILGKGSIKEKAKILFENFDCDNSGYLDLNEMYSIIETLLKIHCEIIPNCILKFYPDSIHKDYYCSIKAMTKGIIEKYKEFISDQGSKFNILEFEKLFTIRHFNFLITPYKLRLYVYSLLLKIKPYIQAVKITLADKTIHRRVNTATKNFNSPTKIIKSKKPRRSASHI